MCGKLVRLAVTLLLISFLRLPCIGDKRLVAACETDRAAINKLSVGIDSVLLSAYLMLLFDALSHPLLGCGQLAKGLALLGRLVIYDALGHTCSYFIHAPILDVT